MPVASAPTRPPAVRGHEPPAVEIVVPVLDEAAALERSIRRLDAYLRESFPFGARITIADNGSTDGTWEVATKLASDLGDVERHAPRGEGQRPRARTPSGREATQRCSRTWTSTSRPTSPRCCPWSRRSSRATATSRSAPGSHRGAHVVRGARRELISRCYNAILHIALGARFSDAQCGFKAIRADRARELLPLVRDRAWFFDTELLVLAAALRAPHPRGPRRLDRRPRLAGRHRLDGGRRPEGCRPARTRLPRGPSGAPDDELPPPDPRIRRDRRRLDARVCGALSRAPRGARRPGRERARAPAHRRCEHRGEPSVHLRGARCCGHCPPPGPGPRGIRARAAADVRRPSGSSRRSTRARHTSSSSPRSSSRASLRPCSGSSSSAPGSSAPTGRLHEHHHRRASRPGGRRASGAAARPAPRPRRRPGVGAAGADRPARRDRDAVPRRPRPRAGTRTRSTRPPSRPGSKSWKAFFFGSFDSSNFITVDKPPASLWVMDLSARLFGVSSWSILVPQALEGVAAVGAPVRDRSPPLLGPGCASRRRRLRADARRGAHVPLRQPGRAPDAPARRRGLRGHARARGRPHRVAPPRGRPDRARLPDEDAPGVPRRTGIRGGLPARRARAAAAADRAAARRRRGAGRPPRRGGSPSWRSGRPRAGPTSAAPSRTASSS